MSIWDKSDDGSSWSSWWSFHSERHVFNSNRLGVKRTRVFVAFYTCLSSLMHIDTKMYLSIGQCIACVYCQLPTILQISMRFPGVTTYKTMGNYLAINTIIRHTSILQLLLDLRMHGWIFTFVFRITSQLINLIKVHYDPLIILCMHTHHYC